MLGDWAAPFAVVVVFCVVVAITFDLLDMVVASMMGVSALMLAGIVRAAELEAGLRAGGPTLALLAGGMVLVRLLQPTGLFERLGATLSGLARGDGRLLVVGMVALVGPLCAVLPNATVVMLMAPAVIVAARRLGADVIAAVVLLVAVANSAGLLTLIGDPATFVVGSGVGMTFSQYLGKVSPGGLLVLLALVPIAAVVFRGLWRVRAGGAAAAEAAPLRHVGFMTACLVVFSLQVLLFVFGDGLMGTLSPPLVAFLGATSGLLVLYHFKVEPVGKVVHDVDWSTLVFIGLMFVMIQGLVRTGVLNGAAGALLSTFGTNYAAAAVFLLAFVGAASAFVPNVPMVATMLLVVKAYLLQADAVPEEAAGAGFAAWPPETLTVFVAMMFGATLGGNATMIGASSNLVAVGILREAGEKVDFMRFARYGAPATAAQLAVAALYVLLIFPLLR